MSDVAASIDATYATPQSEERPARLSPEREAEIRCSLPEAYSAPWHWQPTDDMDGWQVLYATDNPLAGLVASVPDYGENLASFIAEARTAVPELLAELAAVRADAQRALDLLMSGNGYEAARLLDSMTGTEVAS